MLHALRAELAYFRPWLLGGLGIAVGVSTLLTVLMHLPSVNSDAPSFVPTIDGHSALPPIVPAGFSNSSN